MTTHSNILAWENLTDRGDQQAKVHGVAELATTERTHIPSISIMLTKNSKNGFMTLEASLIGAEQKQIDFQPFFFFFFFKYCYYLNLNYLGGNF